MSKSIDNISSSIANDIIHDLQLYTAEGDLNKTNNDTVLIYHNSDHDEDPFYTTSNTGYTSRHRRRTYLMACAAVVAVVLIIVVSMAAGGGGSSSNSAVQGADKAGGNTGGGGAPSGGTGTAESPTSMSELESFLRDNSPTGGLEYDQADSYQRRALDWALHYSDPSSSNLWLQRFALACIYYATYDVPNRATSQVDLPAGTGWLQHNGWVQDNDECSWDRVVCDQSGNVTELHLDSNLLTGTFPWEAQYLKSSLTVLDVTNNLFWNSGDEGNSFLGELTELRYLYTGQSNFFYSGIPTYIGALTHLIEYDCSYSLYFGPLRGGIFASLQDLEYLFVSGNSFNSTIPTELASLPSLKYLYIEQADLIGGLTEALLAPHDNAWSSMIEFWVDKNPGLGGTLPEAIGKWSNLASFSVTECDLTGPLPESIGDLTAMKQMWFYRNRFDGTVPESWGNLAKLERLELEVNDLKGSVPSSICAHKKSVGGLLNNLKADCDTNATGTIACTCCDCCGEMCLDALHRNQSGSSRRRM